METEREKWLYVDEMEKERDKVIYVQASKNNVQIADGGKEPTETGWVSNTSLDSRAGSFSPLSLYCMHLRMIISMNDTRFMARKSYYNKSFIMNVAVER